MGPLIEVPALIALVYVSLWLRPRLFRHESPQPDARASATAPTADDPALRL